MSSEISSSSSSCFARLVFFFARVPVACRDEDVRVTAMTTLRTLLLLSVATACAGIDMKWTPNGEAPAPFSTNARNAMGMDPAAFAGQAQAAPLTPPGGGLQLSIGALIVVYLANNWKVFLALQEMVLTMMKPFLQAAGDKKAAAERLSLAESQAEARKARAARLSAKAKAKPE